jgi:hypothetical protein
MPVSTTVSTGQYHSAVICAQRTRRAAPRRKGRSVRRISLVGLRSDASTLATFQMAANCAAAKQEPRCLQPIQPVQAVDCISVSSTVFGCPAFCCNGPSYLPSLVWLQLSGCLRSRTASLVLSAAALLHALHLRPTFCVRVRLAPLLPSVRFACIRYSASLLQPTPTLPLTESRALLPPPFATSSLLQHLSSHRARRVALASGHESDSEGDTPSRIQHSSSGLMSTCRPPLQRATASLTKAVPELRTAFD